MTEDTKIFICKEDFYLMMKNALIQAGGSDNVNAYKQMPLDDLVNMLARNGIRLVYRPDRHMDSINLSWEPSGREEKNVTPKPERKVLLDSYSPSDSEDSFGR